LEALEVLFQWLSYFIIPIELRAIITSTRSALLLFPWDDLSVGHVKIFFCDAHKSDSFMAVILLWLFYLSICLVAEDAVSQYKHKFLQNQVFCLTVFLFKNIESQFSMLK
jgi:hypothetical protein